MTKTSDQFQNARLKVKRANHHIETLVNESSPLAKNLYEITNGPAYSVAPLAKPDFFDVIYRPKEPIIEHFGAIIGDAVNNLREAMDYWTNTAVAIFTGKRKKLNFPFSEQWKDLETSPNYPTIEKSFIDLAVFIRDNVKPCRDSNLDLWAVTSLCNFNKHNDFIPVVTVCGINNINAVIGRIILQEFRVKGNANNPIGLLRSDTPITIDQNFSTAVEIVFPQGAVFENRPVIPTLLNMSQVVSQTLDALDSFMTPYIK